MRAAPALVAAAVSLLVLGAHFLRRGQLAPVALCLALVGALFVRHPAARRLLQLGLAVAMAVWISTIVMLVQARQAAGEPWTRLLVILGPVALLALVALVALGSRAAREHFGEPAAGGASGWRPPRRSG